MITGEDGGRGRGDKPASRHNEPEMKVSAQLHRDDKIQNSCHFVPTCHHFPAGLSAHPPPLPSAAGPLADFAPPTLFIADQVFNAAFTVNDKCCSDGKMLLLTEPGDGFFVY